MSKMDANKGDHEDTQDDLERLLIEGVSLQEEDWAEILRQGRHKAQPLRDDTKF